MALVELFVGNHLLVQFVSIVNCACYASNEVTIILKHNLSMVKLEIKIKWSNHRKSMLHEEQQC